VRHTHAVGVAHEPSTRQREVWELVTRAHQAAVTTAKIGAAWSEVDAAARRLIESAGCADAFPHITGHGVGFCYHEPVPLLGPGLAGNVELNQVVAIEPAIYGAEPGGFRYEENYLVTESGLENLSPFYSGLHAEA
jgi:Xaa-Pro aminopeptidase